MKYLLQIIVGTVFYLLFGWLVFDVLIGDYTEANTTQAPGFKKDETQFDYTFLLISCLAYATLITYLVSYLLKITKALKAFYVSAITGILVAVMTNCYLYASSFYYHHLSVMLLDVLAAGITVGALGMVVTLVGSALENKIR